MAFSPGESPLYGGGTIHIAFGETNAIREDGDIYCVFEGSSHRHITPATRVNSLTLQSIIPGHNCAEDVKLIILSHLDNKTVASSFTYISDPLYHMAHHLVESVHDVNSLNDLESIKSENFDLALEDSWTLDERLTSAFEHLDLPPDWNILGLSDYDEPVSRETLLHLSARLGLARFTSFLLDQPGASEALHLTNHEGKTPLDIADGLSNGTLAELLANYNPGTMEFQAKQIIHGDSVLRRNKDNSLTLSRNFLQNPRTLEEDLAVLREFNVLIPSDDMHVHEDDSTTDGISSTSSGHLCAKSLSDEVPNGDSDGSDSVIDYSQPPQYSSTSYIQEASCLQDNSSIDTDIDPVNQQTVEGHDSPQPDIGHDSPQVTIGHDSPHAIVGHDTPQPIMEVTSDYGRVPDYGAESSVPYDLPYGPPYSDTKYNKPKPPAILDLSNISNTRKQFMPEQDEIDARQDYVENGGDYHISQVRTANTPPDGAYQQLSSPKKSPLLENSIRRLKGIKENVELLRQVNQSQEQDQDERRESLNRFSTSCPVLAQAQDTVSPSGSTSDEADHYKSMLDVTGQSNVIEEEDELSNEDDYENIDQFDVILPRENMPENVKIQLNDVTLDHSEDAFVDRMSDKEGKPRSLTLSALSGAGKERMEFKNKMSAVGSRSMSLSSLDSQDEEEDDTPPGGILRQDLSTNGVFAPSNRICSANDIDFELEASPESKRIEDEIKRYSVPVQQSPVGHHDYQSHLASNLIKSVSTPSIPSIKELEEDKENNSSRQQLNTSFKTQTGNDSQVKLRNKDGGESGMEPKSRISMFEFLADPSNFEEEESKYTLPRQQHIDIKEEKTKRKSSVFSFSKRDKKKKNDDKGRHRFVSVSFSNESKCDVCGKTLVGKQALQCENCFVNVHNSACKESVMACQKFKMPKSQRQSSFRQQIQRFNPASSTREPQTGSQRLKTSVSFYDKRTELPIARTLQPSSISLSQLPPATTVTTSERKVILEEEDEPDNYPRHPALNSNLSDTVSISMESLDEGAPEINDLDDEKELVEGPEAEAWSVYVDKKVRSKLHKNEIKRQDHIWELISTERKYFKVLKIMQKIFTHGMIQDVKLEKEVVDCMFPRLDDLIDIHRNFLRNLLECQEKSPDKKVDCIADILEKQFEGENGDALMTAYGQFCSRHREAVMLYKDTLKSNRKFQIFIQACRRNEVLQKKGIPECILVVTQRLTKYPTLIEAILKKENDKTEAEHLKRSVGLAKSILDNVNQQIEARELEICQQDIYNRLDAKSSCTYKGRKFKKSDVLSNGRKLLYLGLVSWKNARGKLVEVTLVLLSDLVFFIQDNNQKYSFFSQDNKSCTVSLFKLLVREKGSNRDNKGIYLISQDIHHPEMYELVCKSSDDRRRLIKAISRAIEICPEDVDEGIPSESEEERKILEAKSARLKQLLDEAKRQDKRVQEALKGRMEVLIDMLEVHGRDDVMNDIKSFTDENGDITEKPEVVLQAALDEACHLGHILNVSGDGLTRSESSFNEYDTKPFSSSSNVLKRAETIASYDNTKGSIGKSNSHDSHNTLTPAEQSKRQKLLQTFGRKLGIVRHRSDVSDIRRVRFENHPSLRRVETFSGFEAGSIKKRQSPTDQGMQCPMEQGDMRSSSLHNLSRPEPVSHHEIANRDLKNANRRSSASMLQTSMLTGLLKGKAIERYDSGTCEQGSLGELSVSSLPVPSGEQTASLTQLTQYIHQSMVIVCQKSTQLEGLRVELKLANEHIGRLTSEDRQDKKTASKQHNQQLELEKLRNLQSAISQEREIWDRERTKQQGIIDHQQQKLDIREKEIEKQQTDLKSQKEELQKQREYMQVQIDHFRKQQKQEVELQLQQQKVLNMSTSPKVLSMSNSSPGAIDKLTVLSSSPKQESVFATPENKNLRPAISHRRSSSLDYQKQSLQQGEHFEPMPAEYARSLQEPLNKKKYNDLNNEQTIVSPQRKTSVVKKPDLPSHLLSATNEQKAADIVKQQIPIKLAGLGVAGASVDKKYNNKNDSKAKNKSMTLPTSPQQYNIMNTSASPGFAAPGNRNNSPSNHSNSPSNHSNSPGNRSTNKGSSISSVLPLQLAETLGSSKSSKKTKKESVLYF